MKIENKEHSFVRKIYLKLYKHNLCLSINKDISTHSILGKYLHEWEKYSTPEGFIEEMSSGQDCIDRVAILKYSPSTMEVLIDKYAHYATFDQAKKVIEELIDEALSIQELESI